MCQASNLKIKREKAAVYESAMCQYVSGQDSLFMLGWLFTLILSRAEGYAYRLYISFKGPSSLARYCLWLARFFLSLKIKYYTICHT